MGGGQVQLLGNGLSGGKLPSAATHPHNLHIQTGPPPKMPGGGGGDGGGFFSKLFRRSSSSRLSAHNFGGGRRGALLSSYAYSMERAKRIDVVSRVIFPAVFAIFNLSYWIYYLIGAAREFELSQKNA